MWQCVSMWSGSGWIMSGLGMIRLPAIIPGSEPVPAGILEHFLATVPREPVRLASQGLVPDLQHVIHMKVMTWQTS